MTTGFAEINGTRLYYETAGEGHPLLFGHAGIADSQMWNPQFAHFAERYQAIRYDRRGCGRSVMPADSFSDADDLYQLLRVLNIQTTYCLGASRGAAVALEFTLAHPEMVDVLILVTPGVSTGQPSETLKAKSAAIDAALEAGDLPGAVELELQLWVDGPHRTPDQVDPTIRELVRQMDTHNFKMDNSEAKPQRPARPLLSRLAEIHVPTLILVGEGDVSDILRNADILSAGIVGAQRANIPVVAHMPNMEQPQKFNQIISQFLAAL